MNKRSLALIFAGGLTLSLPLNSIADQASSKTGPLPSPVHEVIDQYCAGCHNEDKKKGDLDLESLSSREIPANSDAWEKVVRKLRTRQMPPAGKRRPDEASYDKVVAELTGVLDHAAAQPPNPGRTDSLRRLNRTEYQNAIRDLLALDIDASALLPKDEASHGFDNVTVGNLSPTLLDRYISAAEKISRLAVGAVHRVGGDTFRVRPDVTQEEHVEGLPLGTRGGTVISHTFPEDAEYEVQIRLTRDRNEEVEGLREKHEIELLLDREEIESFTVSPPKDKNYEKVDQHLKLRFPVKAGPHKLGVTFLKNPSELMETKRQPYQAHFNLHRHPRLTPAIYQVSIIGPYNAKGPGDTPSRRRIFAKFIKQPAQASDEESCAREILSNLMRRAYRRPLNDSDLEKPLELFRTARADGGFDSGIEAGLSAILVSPSFLFRIEQDPDGITAKSAYRISDIELASRLSFFLWSSIPDEELLDCAIRGDLGRSEMIEKQVRRMLADSRSGSLASNFAGQWLYLRNLDSFTPEVRLFPDFDDNLRQAFRTETELFFESIIHEDRSVLDLLDADYTFLNERLAKHYGIPNIYGCRFRRVSKVREYERGGLLRQGSILTVTSYATRTSPVIRGHWILANMIGTPPPPPPASVPALKENTISSFLPVRQRLGEHRANPACANCHNLMDPVGFSLENFDAVGRWRTFEEGTPIDVTGGLPDGNKFEGVEGLQRALLSRPEIFVSTLTEKLLTFALGRGIETFDAPAVRKIVRDAETDHFRFSSLVVAVAKSTPFTMRRAE
ncbi:MAG TPA: DUF1592 domain-containing protein [Verrucomicrobiae bacterium]|nr:DUF1592 domain-containing protein [Verrucomicrobiae bacterium]